MSRSSVAALVLTVLMAGCGGGRAVSLGPVPSVSAPSTPTPTGPETTPSTSPGGPTPSASPSPSGRTISLQVWLVRDGKLFQTERVEPFSVAVGRLSLEALAQGPTADERSAGITTTVSPDTTFAITALAGGLATVQTSMTLPASFTPTSSAPVAQVVYTLTQFSTIQRVRFVDSGEGFSRRDFATLMPAIVVASPAVGSVVGSPLMISGTADVFEATVSVRVLDEDGRVLTSSFTTATCGTGCRGDYAVTVRFSVDHQQPGTVQVFDYSANDGSVENLQSIPVTLAP